MSYEVRGEGKRPLILMPGLLMTRRMHYPLADLLAERGNRVIMFEPLGHGDSSRPKDMSLYSTPIFGEQVIALMDHLEIDQAVIGGPSMGANTSLEAAVLAPERIRGMVIEMPALDNAIPAVALIFTPILYALTFGRPLMSAVASVIRRLPRNGNFYLNVVLDTLSLDPGPSGAVIQGIFFGRAAPPSHLRKQIDVPAIVLGHPRDVIHPFSDAQMLARELPQGKLVNANSVLELRAKPERLTKIINTFLDQCWKPRRATAKRKEAKPKGPKSKRAAG